MSIVLEAGKQVPLWILSYTEKSHVAVNLTFAAKAFVPMKRYIKTFCKQGRNKTMKHVIIFIMTQMQAGLKKIWSPCKDYSSGGPALSPGKCADEEGSCTGASSLRSIVSRERAQTAHRVNCKR